MALTPFFGRRPSSSLFDSSIFDPFSWDPFPHPFSLLPSHDLDAPFRQLYRDASSVANTQVDWKETPDAHIFKADLPGLNKEEIKVQVEDGNVLCISGQRSKEETHKDDNWHRIERSHGSFLRKFRLPENAKPDDMKAQVENGVLTITVPKVQQPKPEVKNIAITG